MNEFKISDELVNDILKKLDNLDPRMRIDFFDAEIGRIGDVFKNQLSQKILKEQQNKISSKTSIPCQCGGRVEYKGTVKKKFFFVNEKAVVYRDRYQCLSCGKTWFPIDDYFHLVGRSYSPSYAFLVCHLISLTTSFSDCKKTLHYTNKPVCSETLIQKIGNEVGGLGTEEEDQWVNRYDEIHGHAVPKNSEAELISVLLDGGRCRVWQNPVKKGDSQWKEVKLGAICHYKKGEDTERGDVTYQIDSKKYIGRIDEKYDDFGTRLYREAMRNGYSNAKKKIFLSDGARTNWEIHEMHFHDAIPILDWYHATEHLASIGRLLHGENSTEFNQWFEKAKSVLYEGDWVGLDHVLYCAKTMCRSKDGKERIAKERQYFVSNRERIKYSDMHGKGYPISSSIIESGMKQLVNRRIKGTEKHWRKNRGNNILKLKIDEHNDGLKKLYQFYLQTV